jgi:hypothetical protein
MRARKNTSSVLVSSIALAVLIASSVFLAGPLSVASATDCCLAHTRKCDDCALNGGTCDVVQMTCKTGSCGTSGTTCSLGSEVNEPCNVIVDCDEVPQPTGPPQCAMIFEYDPLGNIVQEACNIRKCS